MPSTKRLKWLAAFDLITFTVSLQSFSTQNPTQPQPPKPTNLKVLPKNIPHDQLIQTMRDFSKSLGVRCNECHVSKQDSAGKMEFDFASDAKPEKETARKMIKMENGINDKYLHKIDGDFEKISCATCHRGNLKPLVSVDSLPKKQ